MSTIAKLLIMAAAQLSQVSLAVTTQRTLASTSTVDNKTVAMQSDNRARSEVQIRRLVQLFEAKRLDSVEYYKRLKQILRSKD